MPYLLMLPAQGDQKWQGGSSHNGDIIYQATVRKAGLIKAKVTLI